MIIDDIFALRIDKIKQNQNPTKVYAGHEEYYEIMNECNKGIAFDGDFGKPEIVGMRIYRVLEANHLDVV